MPGKSRHKRGKHSSRSKKRAGRPSQPVMATQPITATPTEVTITPPQTPKASVMATTTAAQYPYIFIELRRIGILSGIILAILIVVALVLA